MDSITNKGNRLGSLVSHSVARSNLENSLFTPVVKTKMTSVHVDRIKLEQGVEDDMESRLQSRGIDSRHDHDHEEIDELEEVNIIQKAMRGNDDRAYCYAMLICACPHPFHHPFLLQVDPQRPLPPRTLPSRINPISLPIPFTRPRPIHDRSTTISQPSSSSNSFVYNQTNNNSVRLPGRRYVSSSSAEVGIIPGSRIGKGDVLAADESESASRTRIKGEDYSTPYPTFTLAPIDSVSSSRRKSLDRMTSNLPRQHLSSESYQTPVHSTVSDRHHYRHHYLQSDRDDYPLQAYDQSHPTHQPSFTPSVMSTYTPQHSLLPLPDSTPQNNSSSKRNLTAKKRRKTSPRELEILEEAFKENALPSTAERVRLSGRTGMSVRGVQIWVSAKPGGKSERCDRRQNEN